MASTPVVSAARCDDPALEHVSAAAQHALRTKRLGGTRPFEVWRALFRELAAFDERVDVALDDSKRKVQHSCVAAAITLFAGPFGVMMCGSFLGYPEPSLQTVATATLLVPALLLAFSGYQYCFRASAFVEINLFNEFRYLLVPLLRALRPDIAKGAETTIEFNGAGPIDRKIRATEPVISRRAGATETRTIFIDRWCTLDVPLANKCRLRLTFDSTYARYVREWRNVNGKSRSKTKWKKAQSVRIELRAPRRKLQFGTVAKDCEVVQRAERMWGRCRIKRRLAKVTGTDAPDKSLRPSDVMLHIMKLATMLEPVPERSA